MLSRNLEEVADGVWAWIQQDGTWWINNAGYIRGTDGAALFDTCATRSRTDDLLAAVGSVSHGVPLRWAVNSHAHGDHTYGNCALPTSTLLLAHPATRKLMDADTLINGCPPLWEPVPDWGNVVKRLPDEEVSEKLDLDLGGSTISLRHPGHAAHTPGDLVGWVPEANVLFAGDLVFAGITPLVFMGSVSGARAALAWIESFDADVIVPGHGPVLRAAEIAPELQRHRDYYDFVESIGANALRRGVSALQAAREADLGVFADFADAERLVPNLHRYLADHTDGQVDPSIALSDAVSYLGRPMTSHL